MVQVFLASVPTSEPDIATDVNFAQVVRTVLKKHTIYSADVRTLCCCLILTWVIILFERGCKTLSTSRSNIESDETSKTIIL